MSLTLIEYIDKNGDKQIDIWWQPFIERIRCECQKILSEIELKEELERDKRAKIIKSQEFEKPMDRF